MIQRIRQRCESLRAGFLRDAVVKFNMCSWIQCQALLRWGSALPHDWQLSSEGDKEVSVRREGRPCRWGWMQGVSVLTQYALGLLTHSDQWRQKTEGATHEVLAVMNETSWLSTVVWESREWNYGKKIHMKIFNRSRYLDLSNHIFSIGLITLKRMQENLWGQCVQVCVCTYVHAPMLHWVITYNHAECLYCTNSITMLTEWLCGMAIAGVVNWPSHSFSRQMGRKS